MSGDYRKKIDEALHLVAQEDDDGNNQVCTAWIVVAEWVDFKGTRMIQTITSEDLAPWTGYGMLAYSMENDMYSEEEVDD
jgi:hypothetical protein